MANAIKLEFGKDFTVTLADDIDEVELDRKSLTAADCEEALRFAEALRVFQQELQQQAFMNRQMIGESFANTALRLGNPRSTKPKW